MGERSPIGSVLGVLIVTLALLPACKKLMAPSFPGAKLAEGVAALCAKDYKKVVQARRASHSLQILIPFEGVVESEVSGLDPKAADLLDDLLQAGTRGVLSTDDQPEFVEVILWNPETLQSFAIWRYVPDILRFMHTEFPTMESMERMVMIRVEPESDLSIWPRPATQQEFLARQIVQRMKRRDTSLDAREDLSQPGLLRIVVNNWTSPKKDHSELINWVVQSSRTVLDSYRFKGFHGIELIDGSGSALRRWSI